jgi:type IV secretion system protein TrbF
MESEFYIQARREWDERYGDLVLGKRNWQITSAGLMLLSLILALGIVWMSARTKVIPFVVEVDKLGYALTIPEMENLGAGDRGRTGDVQLGKLAFYR